MQQNEATPPYHIKANERTPEKFCNSLNGGLLAELSDSAPNNVCVETARRWMHFLGFDAERQKKGYYVDGHEREDVVQHRESYIAVMEQLDKNNEFVNSMATKWKLG